MEFSEVVRARRMTRRYDTSRPVAAGYVEALLDAGLRAPSAGNSQGRHLLALTRPADVERYWHVTAGASDNAWLRGMRTAPVLIIVYSERDAYERRYAAPDKSPTEGGLERRWPVPYWHVDAGMAALLIQLAAVDRRLGCCFFGVPTDRVDELARAFGVPPTMIPVGVVSVGHPADPSGVPAGGRARPARRRRGHVVSYGRFGAGADPHPTDADGEAQN